jgi:tryptophan synthase beta chain
MWSSTRRAACSDHVTNKFYTMSVPPSLAISNAPPCYASVDELRAAADYGAYGGRFIPETLVAAHEELERIYVQCSQDPEFARELERLGRDYIGRPTPLYHAKRLSALAGGAQIWLKREELAFTGSHKINNALGQALVAKRIGKPRVIAETGAGQHGVATATACALLGECEAVLVRSCIPALSIRVWW